MTTSPITSITDELLAELELEAGNATPGPWTADFSPDGEFYISGPCDEFICGTVGHVHDANLIALANPATILALLAERAELKRDAERYRWLYDKGDDCQWMNLIRVDPADFDNLDAAIDAAIQEAKP